MLLPPARLVANVVRSPVMSRAERHDPFIAHLATHCPRLRKPEVVSLARYAATMQARLSGNVTEVFFVTKTPRRANWEAGFVDADPNLTNLGLTVLGQSLLL